ncbi:MAG: glycoside hydrolase family 3 C-terminal domain-containing protein [Parabacteroides sp.]|nr:glycoside hydrolase family 3 C-terminal domain-containing protein [Parabacteroides sp.]
MADTKVKHGEKSVVNVQLEAKKENQLVIEARGMQKNVHYSLCWETPRNKQAASPEKVAASSDLAIVFMRDDRASEGKDRTTLAMTEHQQSFIEKIIKANPNTIVIIGARHAPTSGITTPANTRIIIGSIIAISDCTAISTSSS